MELMQTKQCSRCKQTKGVEQFGKQSSRKDGLRDWCKECVREYSKQYKLSNHSRVLDDHQRYNREHRDEINQRARTAYANGRNITEKERLKRYSIEHPKEYKAIHQRWSRRNRHIRRATEVTRQARKAHNGGHCTGKDIQLQRENQNGKCWWCGKPFNQADRQLMESIDHRIPIVRGGTSDPSNLVIAHMKCNQSKHDKMPWEWCGRLL